VACNVRNTLQILLDLSTCIIDARLHIALRILGSTLRIVSSRLDVALGILAHVLQLIACLLRLLLPATPANISNCHGFLDPETYKPTIGYIPHRLYDKLRTQLFTDWLIKRADV
jgi:hypothetical protein